MTMPTQRLIGKGATPEIALQDLEARAAGAGVNTLEGQRTYDVNVYKGKRRIGTGSGADYTSAHQQALENAGLRQEVVVQGTYKEQVTVATTVSSQQGARPAGPGPSEQQTVRYTSMF